MSVPRATARLQLHRDFDFDRAAEVVPYYATLGISHIYSSPILTARSGSTHGYDIVDPTRINPDLAGVRVEQDDVFEATHALIFRLHTEGLIDGVRIDHADGLADPGAYCRKLRRRLQAAASQRPPELSVAPAYIVVDKILALPEFHALDCDPRSQTR